MKYAFGITRSPRKEVQTCKPNEFGLLELDRFVKQGDSRTNGTTESLAKDMARLEVIIRLTSKHTAVRHGPHNPLY
jgi:hypothetical protein